MDALYQIENVINQVPPCGIICSACKNHVDQGGKCIGYPGGCRKCKTLYGCCVEKKGLSYCYQCRTFPCSRFRKFNESWLKLGQDLIKNQMEIQLILEKNGKK